MDHSYPQEGYEDDFDESEDLRLERGQIVCVTEEVDEDGDGIIDWIVGSIQGGDGHTGAWCFRDCGQCKGEGARTCALCADAWPQSTCRQEMCLELLFAVHG